MIPQRYLETCSVTFWGSQNTEHRHVVPTSGIVSCKGLFIVHAWNHQQPTEQKDDHNVHTKHTMIVEVINYLHRSWKEGKWLVSKLKSKGEAVKLPFHF